MNINLSELSNNEGTTFDIKLEEENSQGVVSAYPASTAYIFYTQLIKFIFYVKIYQ